MKVSSKAKYGLLALVEIAHHANQWVTASMIAEKNSISLIYLGQILSTLSINGIVASQRGSGGGYRLARPSSQILLTDIMAILDHNLCFENQQKSWNQECELEHILDECVWKNLDYSIIQITDGITLENIMNQCNPKMIPYD